MDGTQDGRNLEFRFNGNALEYFKIWIVNITLSIITLGIYSAWAKVRTRRYFYGNTTLDGASFDFLADPLAILKGRMIVFAFILAYAVSTQFIPLLELAFLVIYIIALPWMVVKSMQFNLRNTAYRNIRFHFGGRLGEAAGIFIGLSLLSVITLGLAAPYVVKRYKQFAVENSYFGQSKFEFHAGTGSFYAIYLKAFLIPFILGILAAIAVPAYQGYIAASKANHAQVSVQHSQSSESPSEQSSEYSIEWQSDGNMQDPGNDWNTQAPQTQNQGQGQNTQPPQAPPPDAFAFIPLLVSMMIYGLIIVYIQTRTTNLVLNNTTLGAHRIESHLRVRNMFYLYFTNMVAIVVSLGMLIPWAKIRVTRYRMANTSFIAVGDLDSFVAHEQENITATGGEFTDAFDIDLGF